MPGKANKLIFANSEKARDAITASQKKEIERLYQEWANDMGERAKYYQNKTTASSILQERQARELKKALAEQSHVVANEVYNGIKQNIYTVADAVVRDNVNWLKELGFTGENLDAAFSSIPDDIVRMLVTGQIYEGGWNLSSRIWSSNEKTLSNCYEIVAKGVAENRPIYDIAKELEKYVSPQTAKSWNPMIRMKNTQTGQWEYKRIYRGKVDYNAQRLARTLVQHGYQQSFIATTEKNPFVLRYQWDANGSRVCPICQDRDGQTYEKGNLPMDHPNGMCTMVPVIDDNMIDRLADWGNSPDGTFPEIDAFAKELGYTPPKPEEKKLDVNSLGTSKNKTFNGWYNKLDAGQKAFAKSLKEQSGLTWQKWYEQNIYNGTQPLDASGGKTKAGTVVFDKQTWQQMFDNQTTAHMLDTEQANFDKMTKPQSKAIVTYTGSAYSQMNGYLRKVAGGMSETEAKYSTYISDANLKAIKSASAGLKKSKTQEDMVVYRGTRIGELAGFMTGDFSQNEQTLRNKTVEELNDMFSGTIATYAGFTSTCSVNDRGQWSHSGFRGGSKSVELAIYVPKGTPATSVMGISQYGTSEGEFLLNAGTKIYIQEIEDNNGKIRVWANIVK